MTSTPALAEHFFRHEYGRLVASFSRRVGLAHLEAVEDAAQAALLAALERWRTDGVPDNPSAWLYRVAHNRLMGALRQQTNRRRILDGASSAPPAGAAPQEAAASALLFTSEVQDAMLRMLVVCCDDALPPPSQIALALKTLCGFSVREIAARLITTEANVYKRLGRARDRLRASPPDLDAIDAKVLRDRRAAVQRVLYQLFTEGHLASHPALALRQELCDEALRLTHLLADHPAGDAPDTQALLALMHLHRARLSSRDDGAGGLLLLEEQDRSTWDTAQIALGLACLARSAAGDHFSRYHAEAAVAAEHCLAPSFAETRWSHIAGHYALLEKRSPSPLVRLNRALAVAEAEGAAAGLALLDGVQPPTWLEGSHQWSAALADLHCRAGHREAAARYRAQALALAPSDAIRHALARRLSRSAAVVDEKHPPSRPSEPEAL